MTITRPQADNLAGLLRTIRPHWDHLAIMTVLTNLQDRDLADIAHAAIRTAEDTSMRTPQSLAFLDSPHWQHRPAHHDRHDEDRAEMETRIRNRQQDIARCPYCNSNGRLDNGYPCPHEDPAARAARVKAWADKARANLAEAKEQA